MYAPRQYPDGSPWGPPPAPPTHPHHPYDPSNPPPSSFLPRIPELDGQQQQQQAGYGWMPQGPPAGEWAADPRYARSHNGAEYGYPPPPPPHPSGPPNMYADYNLYRFRMKPLRNGRLVIFDDFGRELRAHRDGSLRLVPLVMDEDEDGGGFGGDVKRMPPGDMSSKVPVKRPVPEEYPVDGYDKRRCVRGVLRVGLCTCSWGLNASLWPFMPQTNNSTVPHRRVRRRATHVSAANSTVGRNLQQTHRGQRPGPGAVQGRDLLPCGAPGAGARQGEGGGAAGGQFGFHSVQDLHVPISGMRAPKRSPVQRADALV
ncbi:hypothetical protein M427DRAFT_422242 [Gonapodya prolifera JEL478]|uniref:Uncharacterized protein n=1 Tax=Gonapodya prolifera (strain JEL478) TaxID=1344416 RepID=A0A139A537_GONPJ|nr:hypothetical protein M427DRAFT_422242 [Gonapodya prolifera JEL478]|eukprot:KXS11748.1 hypothetical protein M427DRAFT_422242 [Gonapodya prolifera JEL478]